MHVEEGGAAESKAGTRELAVDSVALSEYESVEIGSMARSLHICPPLQV